MAVSRPTEPVELVFILQGNEYRATLRRGDIVHVGIHKALPAELTVGHRLTFATANGHEVFADNFLGDLADFFGSTELITIAQPIAAKSGEWRNVGFDHLAITVQDRPAARDFFHDVLQLQIMRDDPHLTVMSSGSTALFLFDAGQEAPLSNGLPSSWHHIGFVVDDLEAAYAHLQANRQWLNSDFTLLDRHERWSLYFFYKNGDVTFMIQFSQVKEAWRGFPNANDAKFAELLYDYSSRPYGLQFENVEA